ncbi:MAG: ParB N-terminal domain-containing protein [Candidatus Eisenbacteria bacterium]|nr:ParB N-terminal domain-containing protein [Candidatus Eisenbacteria bacterium]
MSTEAAKIEPPGVHWQDRRLGRTILRTYRTTVDLDDVLPNPKQPRLGPKEDPELQRQIEANEGIFEPLLLEPHPDHPGKFSIIDGDRRWTNSKVLVEVQKKDQYRKIAAEVTDQTLTEEERLRVWIYIHRQRREWDAKEKEMVAYRLVDLVGRASAANMLGITVRELDKLVEIYELSEKLTNLPDPATSITWAREIKNLNRKLLTTESLNAIIRRVNDQQISNSKDIRKLRQVLRDPVARDEFLSDSGSIDSALLKLAPAPTKKRLGLAGDIQALAESIRSYPWTTLAELKGDASLIRSLEETAKLLKELRRTLAKR